MHRILSLIMLLGAGASSSGQWFQSPDNPDCPVLTVTCPEEVESGKPLTFKARLEGGKTKWEPSYNWTVDKGKIKRGQGIATIEVDLEGQVCTEVTATVEVGGLDPSCRRSASCTACTR